MSLSQDKLEGIPAMMYSVFWQTREMGFLKKILEDRKVDRLRILFFFTDYKPGGLITFDGNEGDFSVEPIESLENIGYDGAIIGKLRPVIKSLEGNVILRGIWNLISRKVKLKGKLKLYKFLRVLMRCAI